MESDNSDDANCCNITMNLCSAHVRGGQVGFFAFSPVACGWQKWKNSWLVEIRGGDAV